jgi:hypothetical protein
MTSLTARRALVLVLPGAVLATLICGLAYALIQYDLRSGANDPQYQLAEDGAAALDGGSAPAMLVDPVTVDVSTALAPFVAVYDVNGTPLASDGRLDGQIPTPPTGVFASARQNPPDVVTWQPRAGVRIAVVVVPWRNGFVLAGRSLRLVEEREDQALRLAALGWLGSLLGLGVVCLVAALVWPDRPPAASADVGSRERTQPPS